MRRGELWLARGKGNYLDKARPVLIVVEPDDSLDSTVTCLLTSVASDDIPSRVRVEPSEQNGLAKTSWVMTDKIVAIERASLLSRLGILETDILQTVLEKLRDMFT